MFIAKFCLLFPFYTFRLFLCYKNKVLPCNSVPPATHIKKKNPKNSKPNSAPWELGIMKNWNTACHDILHIVENILS